MTGGFDVWLHFTTSLLWLALVKAKITWWLVRRRRHPDIRGLLRPRLASVAFRWRGIVVTVLIRRPSLRRVIYTVQANDRWRYLKGPFRQWFWIIHFPVLCGLTLPPSLGMRRLAAEPQAWRSLGLGFTRIC